MLICLSMDKWALRDHFYSYVDSVWSLYYIGPCCHVIVQVVCDTPKPGGPVDHRQPAETCVSHIMRPMIRATVG